MFENLVQGYVAVGKVYHRDGRVGAELVVDRQPPEVLHPRESALHPPGRHEIPPRQHRDLEPRAEPLHHPVGQASPVPAVRQDPREAAGRPAQPVEDEHGALAVVDVGGVHRRAFDKSKTVSDNVLLAPLHLLVPVYAAVRVHVVRRPHAARVDDAQAWLRPPAEPPAGLADQKRGQLLDNTLVTPLAKIIIDGLPWPVFRGERPPLRARKRGLGASPARSFSASSFCSL